MKFGAHVALADLFKSSYTRIQFLFRDDHSSRGVLPSVICLSLVMKPRKWGVPGPVGSVAPWGKNTQIYTLNTNFGVIKTFWIFENITSCYQ